MHLNQYDFWKYYSKLLLLIFTVASFVIGFLGIGRAKEETEGKEKAVDEAEIELENTKTTANDKVRNCSRRLFYICVWNSLHPSDLRKA